MPEVQQRENPALQLADKIEVGMPHVDETKCAYLVNVEGSICGCAIGMAFVGHFGDAEQAFEACNSNCLSGEKEAADIIGIPLNLARSVSGRHFGGTPAADIVKMLRNGAFDNSF